MDLVVGQILSQHVASGGLALVERIVPVFDAHSLFEYRVVVVGDVACSENPFDIGATILINDNAIVDLHAGLCHGIHNGFDTHSHDREITVDRSTRCGHDPFD